MTDGRSFETKFAWCGDTDFHEKIRSFGKQSQIGRDTVVILRRPDYAEPTLIANSYASATVKLILDSVALRA